MAARVALTLARLAWIATRMSLPQAWLARIAALRLRSGQARRRSHRLGWLGSRRGLFGELRAGSRSHGLGWRGSRNRVDYWNAGWAGMSLPQALKSVFGVDKWGYER